MQQRSRVGLARQKAARRQENVRPTMEAVEDEIAGGIEVVGPPLDSLIRVFLPHEKAPLQRQWRLEGVVG